MTERRWSRRTTLLCCCRQLAQQWRRLCHRPLPPQRPLHRRQTAGPGRSRLQSSGVAVAEPRRCAAVGGAGWQAALLATATRARQTTGTKRAHLRAPQRASLLLNPCISRALTKKGAVCGPRRGASGVGRRRGGRRLGGLAVRRSCSAAKQLRRSRADPSRRRDVLQRALLASRDATAVERRLDEAPGACAVDRRSSSCCGKAIGELEKRPVILNT